MTAAAQIFTRHFSAKTRKALTSKGIRFMGLTSLPGDGPMPWANASTGYTVNDNGTCKVWTFAQVLKAAE